MSQFYVSLREQTNRIDNSFQALSSIKKLLNKCPKVGDALLDVVMWRAKMAIR
jgi:hypothetical protein